MVVRVLLLESVEVNFHVKVIVSYVFDTSSSTARFDSTSNSHIISVAANASALSPSALSPNSLAFALPFRSQTLTQFENNHFTEM